MYLSLPHWVLFVTATSNRLHQKAYAYGQYTLLYLHTPTDNCFKYRDYFTFTYISTIASVPLSYYRYVHSSKLVSLFQCRCSRTILSLSQCHCVWTTVLILVRQYYRFGTTKLVPVRQCRCIMTMRQFNCSRTLCQYDYIGTVACVPQH